ncbi:MAG: hypothetical protein ABL888_03795 [Pirellulaceae bacterium]
MTDYTTAPIAQDWRALFALLTRACQDSTAITQEHINEAKSAGWSDEALYDAFSVCALFQFYNTWIDCTGVHDMPAGSYQAMGQRLAANGYVF